MNTARANTLVITSVAVTGVLTFVNGAQTGRGFPLRSGVGLAVAAVALTTAATFTPDLAAGIAVLMLASSVFVYGGPALAAITTATR